MLEAAIIAGGCPPIIELDGTSIVVDVCEIFDGPRFPYGLGEGV